jgi:FkbM family methyltransferase
MENLVRKVRPAPLAGLLARAFCLNRRRYISTSRGTFYLNPVSQLGWEVTKSEYEPEMRTTLERYLSPGATFIDLGANEGYFSVISSRLVGQSGRVFAIEPQSRLKDVIEKNLAANDCTNVTVLQRLVSDKPGTAKLYITPSMNTGGSSLYRPNRYPLPSESIPSYSLADLLAELRIEHCDLMKVDIEGAEWEVFMPAAEVLRRGVLRNIALETHPSILAKRGLNVEDLHAHMRRNSYQLVQVPGSSSVYSFVG